MMNLCLYIGIIGTFAVQSKLQNSWVVLLGSMILREISVLLLHEGS